MTRKGIYREMSRPRGSIAVVILLLTLTKVTPVSCTLSFLPYVNDKHGFSIYPPAGWTMDDKSDFVSKVPGAVVYFWGPREPDTGGTVNMLICTKAVATSVSLSEWVSSGVAEATLGIPAYGIVSKQMRSINELPCHEVVATMTGQSIYGAVTIKQKAVAFLEKGNVYWISFMASLKYYDRYLPDFEESLQTFRLGPPKTDFPTIYLAIIAIVVLVVSSAMILIYRRRKASGKATSLLFVRTTCPNCGSDVTVDSQNRTCEKCGFIIPT